MVNFDDKRYKDVAKKIFELGHPDKYVEEEIIMDQRHHTDMSTHIDSNSFEELVMSIIDKEIQSITVPVTRLTQEEKIELIKRLDQKGIFMMKGTVEILVDKLDSSPASIYRYLRESKKD